jgi:hypothetical protein
MKRKWMLTLMLTLFAAALGAAPAQATMTSVYVADQPGFSLTVKREEGYGNFIVSLRATSFCRGVGEDEDGYNDRKATHRGFWNGARLKGHGDHLRLVAGTDGLFESQREVLDVELLPDRIVGTFYSRAEGEGIGGRCQTGDYEGDPHVSFEARRYVRAGTELATRPDPAADAFYAQHSEALDIFLWADDSAVTKLQGAVGTTCTTRSGKKRRYRRGFQVRPPFPLVGPERSFEGHAGRRWLTQVGAAELSGQISGKAAFGTYRAAFAHRKGKNARFDAWCWNVSLELDDSVRFRATRFVPVAPVELGSGEKAG